MAHISLQLKDVSRYQIEYPLSNPDSKSLLSILSNSPLEASYTTVVIQDSDQAEFTFDKSFTNTPSVIAGLISLSESSPAPSVNVYVESVTKSGGVVRTSAPVTSASIAVHAIYTSA